MVAAGSGTWDYIEGTGMNAGALTGESGESASSVYGFRVSYGANQTSGGGTHSSLNYVGSFGLAGYMNSTGDWGATGGGGYYGGTSIYNAGASGGGSSFISGYNGCDAIFENSTEGNIYHSHQPNHYSGLVFFDTVMLGGKEVMPLPKGGKSIGFTGHGVAKITPFSLECYITHTNKKCIPSCTVLFILSIST